MNYQPGYVIRLLEDSFRLLIASSPDGHRTVSLGPSWTTNTSDILTLQKSGAPEIS